MLLLHPENVGICKPGVIFARLLYEGTRLILLTIFGHVHIRHVISSDLEDIANRQRNFIGQTNSILLFW